MLGPIRAFVAIGFAQVFAQLHSVAKRIQPLHSSLYTIGRGQRYIGHTVIFFQIAGQLQAQLAVHNQIDFRLRQFRQFLRAASCTWSRQYVITDQRQKPFHFFYIRLFLIVPHSTAKKIHRFGAHRLPRFRRQRFYIRKSRLPIAFPKAAAHTAAIHTDSWTGKICLRCNACHIIADQADGATVFNKHNLRFHAFF